MSFQFDPLGERLLNAGVSPRYVRRYLTELSEHAADIAAEAERAGASQPGAVAATRLGTMDDLATAVIDRKELRSWAIRAPWAVFLLAPSFLLVAIDAVSVAGIVALAKLTMPPAGMRPAASTPEWFAGLAATINGFSEYALPLLLGWTMALLATRQRMRPLWPTIGLLVIACLAAASELHISVPVAPNTHGEINLGFETQASVLPKILLNILLTVPVYFAWRRWKPAPMRPS